MGRRGGGGDRLTVWLDHVNQISVHLRRTSSGRERGDRGARIL